MSNIMLESIEKEYIAMINKIHETIRKEASLKCLRELEAIRFLQYSILKSRNKILTNDLKNAKIRDKHMLNLFRRSVTDVQLDSVDILPEALKRVQRMWHQKYDTLLSQNKRLKRQIIAMDCTVKEKQKEAVLDNAVVCTCVHTHAFMECMRVGPQLSTHVAAVTNVCQIPQTNRRQKRKRQKLFKRRMGSRFEGTCVHPKGKAGCAGGAENEEEKVEKQLPSGKTKNRNQAAGRPVQAAGAPTMHPPFFFLP